MPTKTEPTRYRIVLNEDRRLICLAAGRTEIVREEDRWIRAEDYDTLKAQLEQAKQRITELEQGVARKAGCQWRVNYPF